MCAEEFGFFNFIISRTIRYNADMTFRRFLFLILLTCFFGSGLQARTYEFRNGGLYVKPGTESQADDNITIDDLISTLLEYQKRLGESDEKLRKRDQQILQLQEEIAATKREMTLLKNHYFRQF